MSFLGYGLLACAIAVSFSSIELLTKYESRSLREIFGTRYYLGFAALNCFFCFIVYWSLPYLGKVVVTSQVATYLEGPLIRAITAGFGYLALARTSILDIKIRGETVGVGFDAIYNGLAQYLLRHHSRQLSQAIRDEFSRVYRQVTDAPLVMLATARLLVSQLDQNESQKGRDQINLSLAGNPPPNIMCLSLYIVIRSCTLDAVSAQNAILNTQTDLANDQTQRSALVRELNWLSFSSAPPPTMPPPPSPTPPISPIS
jgi:hypothetical protein